MPNAPTNNRGRRPKSRFGAQLEEKQNLKDIYGIRERQLKKYFTRAQRAEGETGPKLIETLEGRLDNAVFRAGMAETRAQARQMVSHGFFAVNERAVNVPSIQLKVGDKVRIKEAKRKKEVFKNFTKKMESAQTAEWLQLNDEGFGFEVVAIPDTERAGVGVGVQEVVEFLTR